MFTGPWYVLAAGRVYSDAPKHPEVDHDPHGLYRSWGVLVRRQHAGVGQAARPALLSQCDVSVYWGCPRREGDWAGCSTGYTKSAPRRQLRVAYTAQFFIVTDSVLAAHAEPHCRVEGWQPRSLALDTQTRSVPKVRTRIGSPVSGCRGCRRRRSLVQACFESGGRLGSSGLLCISLASMALEEE